MRVLFANPYASGASGVTTFVRSLVEQLRARGHDASPLEVSAERAPLGLRNAYMAMKTARGLIRARGTFDVLHAQQLHPQSLVAGLVARALGKSIVLTVHGRSPSPRGLRGILFRGMERACLRVPHRVVFVAKSLRDSVGSGTVIPNGIDANRIRGQLGDREALRREFGVPPSFVLVFLGRVTADKGFLVLLAALEVARASVSDGLSLVAIGPASEEVRSQLRKRAPTPGVFVFELGERSDATRLLSLGDVFVLPSFHEGLPFSVLEAMAAGLPVIAARVGDLPEVVRPGETGWLVDPGDVGQLAATIAEAAKDSYQLLRMGSRGASLIAESFSLGRAVEGYLDLYRALGARSS